MNNLSQSIREWTPTQRRRAAVLTCLLGLPAAVLAALRIDRIFHQADTNHYLALAAGQPAMMPFASRQLSPLIVRTLVATFHLSLHAAFFFLGTVALLAFFGSVLWLFLRSAAPRFLFPALFGLLFWAEQFNALVLPDILYGALLCLFLLLLRSRHILLAALLLFPLALSRESTILTLACFLLAGWRRLRLHEALTAVASMLAGILVVKHLTANALPNNENISPVFYLFAKMPWNLRSKTSSAMQALGQRLNPLLRHVPTWQHRRSTSAPCTAIG